MKKLATFLPFFFALMGCATSPRISSLCKYEYFVVDEAYYWRDGGTITMSITAYENDVVSQEYHLMLVSPLGRDLRLPDRLYSSSHLVEYGSPEESEILQVLKQVAASDADFRAYRRYAEHVIKECISAKILVDIEKEKLTSKDLTAENRLGLKRKIASLEAELPTKATVNYLREQIPEYPEVITEYARAILHRYRQKPNETP